MTKGKYAWGDGRGKVHSIPLATHKQNQQALRALGGSTDLTAPPSGTQAYREATAAANSQFGPQLQAARQLQTNVEPWFHDYMARVAGYAQAAQSQANPVLSQATAYQQGAAAQAPPGLDPNSEAGQQAAQAASGRQALAQLGLDALNTQNTATQDLFKGQGAVAARELPGAMTAAAQRTAGAKSQRDSAVTTFLTGARQNAQNYAIARGTLGLNTDKAAADAANTAASTAERTRHDKASETNTAAGTKNQATQGYGPGRSGQNKYGFTYDEWTALSKQQQNDWRSGKNKPGKQDSTGPYGVKLATPTQVTDARSSISQAHSLVDDLKASGMSRGDIRATLLQGGQVQTGSKVVKQLTGRMIDNPNGDGTKIPETRLVKVPTNTREPRVKAAWLDVALDLAFDGGVTSATAQQLHKAGYLVGRLGLKPVAPRVGTAPVAPGANGQQRPT
jgi:hypothetical protein